MNNRIYPKSIFDKAMKDYDLKIRNLHCPKCLDNYLGYVDEHTGTIYLNDYKCYMCSNVFDMSDALTKQDVRNKKIDIVLKTK